jgi:hypothetical protein
MVKIVTEYRVRGNRDRVVSDGQHFVYFCVSMGDFSVELGTLLLEFASNSGTSGRFTAKTIIRLPCHWPKPS